MIKIINITDVQKNITARFSQEGGGFEYSEVACLGLCEDGGVHYICHSADGSLHVATESSNFHDVVFR